MNVMRRNQKEINKNLTQTSLSDFLESYNKNIPVSFPRASVELLKKFKETHPALFKKGDTWSLDQHRKKLMDWIPQNKGAL